MGKCKQQSWPLQHDSVIPKFHFLIVCSTRLVVQKVLFELQKLANRICRRPGFSILQLFVNQSRSPKLAILKIQYCVVWQQTWNLLCAKMESWAISPCEITSGKKRVDRGGQCPIVATHKHCSDQVYWTSCMYWCLWYWVLGQDITGKVLRFFVRNCLHLSTYDHITSPCTWLKLQLRFSQDQLSRNQFFRDQLIHF